jgi:hypothetical protein
MSLIHAERLISVSSKTVTCHPEGRVFCAPKDLNLRCEHESSVELLRHT